MLRYPLCDPFGISQNIVVPKPQDRIAVRLNHRGALGIDLRGVLTAIRFDN